MKNVIVTVGEILLGAALFLLIIGPGDSLKTAAGTFFDQAITSIENLIP